jgi:hypothetical protein
MKRKRHLPWRELTQHWRRQEPFAKNLMQLRFDSGKSAGTMSRLLGVPVARYELWEHGIARMPQRFIRPVAKALRIGPAQLGAVRRRRHVQTCFYPSH